jgi:hypothetical protein
MTNKENYLELLNQANKLLLDGQISEANELIQDSEKDTFFKSFPGFWSLFNTSLGLSHYQKSLEHARQIQLNNINKEVTKLLEED